MPRFVLLRHECPPDFAKPSHWDLMLEDDGALLTWSLVAAPVAGGPPVGAERLGNHRLAYLDYEGPVSGDRGEVRRVAAGAFRWLQREPPRWCVELDGIALQGTLVVESPDGDCCQVTLTP